jgi:hypothetical protein
LRRTFEKGQGECKLNTHFWYYRSSHTAYVALSRATSLATLQVVNFDPIKYARSWFNSRSSDPCSNPRVIVHPRVLEWYNGNGSKHGRKFDDEFDEFDEFDEMDNDEDAIAAYFNCN